MQKVRIIAFIGFVLAAGFGYLYFTKAKDVPESIKQKVPFLQNIGQSGSVSLPSSLSALKIPYLPANTNVQFDAVKDRTGHVGQTVGQVLGEAVKEASPSSSLQERAFDYARYMYCQQVVKDYETRTKN